MYPNTKIEALHIVSKVDIAEAAEEPPSTPQPTAAPTPNVNKKVVPVVIATPNVNDSHEDWMIAAGIALSDFGYVEFIIQKESGWRPDARNGKEGACGLVQALPCSKLGEDWADPIVALTWGNNYVSRYGGWSGAYDFWVSHHWY